MGLRITPRLALTDSRSGLEADLQGHTSVVHRSRICVCTGRRGHKDRRSDSGLRRTTGCRSVGFNYEVVITRKRYTPTCVPASRPLVCGTNCGTTTLTNNESPCDARGFARGRYWDRTSDLFRVREARYRCANRPRARWRWDSNPRIRLCRPLPRHSATPPPRPCP